MWEYTKPSKAIGCSYSPDATGLNIHWLPPQGREPLVCPIPPEGMFGYPSKQWMEMVECYRKKYEKSKPKECDISTVSLKVSTRNGDGNVNRKQDFNFRSCARTIIIREGKSKERKGGKLKARNRRSMCCWRKWA